RLHHRTDLTYRTLTELPQSRVALSWQAADEAPDLVEEFIGIVRGRTVNSWRGRGAARTPQEPSTGGTPRRGAAAGKPSGRGTRTGSGGKGASGGKGGQGARGSRGSQGTKGSRGGGKGGRPRRRG
ncbi:LysR family transcriptional regulator, partial [Streptomyces sp. NPDC059578]